MGVISNFHAWGEWYQFYSGESKRLCFQPVFIQTFHIRHEDMLPTLSFYQQAIFNGPIHISHWYNQLKYEKSLQIDIFGTSRSNPEAKFNLHKLKILLCRFAPEKSTCFSNTDRFVTTTYIHMMDPNHTIGSWDDFQVNEPAPTPTGTNLPEPAPSEPLARNEGTGTCRRGLSNEPKQVLHTLAAKQDSLIGLHEGISPYSLWSSSWWGPRPTSRNRRRVESCSWRTNKCKRMQRWVRLNCPKSGIYAHKWPVGPIQSLSMAVQPSQLTIIHHQEGAVERRDGRNFPF